MPTHAYRVWLLGGVAGDIAGDSLGNRPGRGGQSTRRSRRRADIATRIAPITSTAHNRPARQ